MSTGDGNGAVVGKDESMVVLAQAGMREEQRRREKVKEIIEVTVLNPSVQAGEEMAKEVGTWMSSRDLNEVDVRPSSPDEVQG